MDKIKHLSIRAKNLTIFEYFKAKWSIVRLAKEVLKKNGRAIIEITIGENNNSFYQMTEIKED